MGADKISKLEGSDLWTFLLGGRATFTLLNTTNQKRQTYRVNKGKKPGIYFVNVRGDGQATDKTVRHKWISVGMIIEPDTPRQKFILMRKSEVTMESMAFRGFNWLWTKLVTKATWTPTMEVWHEGRCGKCGRQLTDPESIRLGFGPECLKKLGR